MTLCTISMKLPIGSGTSMLTVPWPGRRVVLPEGATPCRLSQTGPVAASIRYPQRRSDGPGSVSPASLDDRRRVRQYETAASSKVGGAGVSDEQRLEDPAFSRAA